MRCAQAVSGQLSAFSFWISAVANRHVRAKPICGMKSSRRAKNMEDSNTVRLRRKLSGVSFQHSAFERHEIVAACKEFGG